MAAAAKHAGKSASPSVLLHDTFKHGVSRWKHPKKIKVSLAKAGHRDARGMRLAVPRSTRAHVATPLAKTRTPGRRVYRARAVVRTSQKDLQAGLRVREIRNGRVVAQSVKKVKLTRGKWSAVKTKYHKRRADSRLSVQVFMPVRRHRQAVVVDDVRLNLAPKPSVTPRKGCAINQRGIPSCEALFGASVGLNGDPSKLEGASGGQNLGLHRTFYQASQVTKAVKTARRDLAAGRLPWISFKLPDGWAAMANGSGDAWARDIAKRLSSLPGPVWVAFHHEPELDGNIAQWTKIQQRLAPIVRRTAPNVAYTIILMGWHQFYGETDTYNLNKIMPKNKVDVVGFDLYNRYGTPGSNRTDNTNLRKEYFNRISSWAKNHNIEWAIGEIGYTDKAFAADRDWLLKTYRDMVATGGIGMSYFDSAPASATGDWLLDTKARVAAFTEVQQESVYLR